MRQLSDWNCERQGQEQALGVDSVLNKGLGAGHIWVVKRAYAQVLEELVKKRLEREEVKETEEIVKEIEFVM